MNFEIAIYRVLHERSKSFKKKRLLHIHYGLIVANQNRKTRFRTLFIVKLLTADSGGFFTENWINFEMFSLLSSPFFGFVEYLSGR